MRGALAKAVSLVPRWEFWVFVGAQVVFRSAYFHILREFPAIGRMGTTPFSSMAVSSLIVSSISALLMAASMVLLLPLVRGGRGLDPEFLFRHVTTVLAGAVIAVGGPVSVHIADPIILYSAVPNPDAWIAAVFFVTDLFILMCAWYIHGREAQDRGRRAPGAAVSLRAGPLAGSLGLWLPGILVRRCMEAAFSPHLEELPMTLIGFAYQLAMVVVPLFFAAWFFGLLGEGEPREEPA